jgi:predicted transposase/invertase (TIGR01784 family)
MPEQSREEMCGILDRYNSEEVEQVVSNMEQTLRKMYEDAKDEGKIAGMVEGEKEGIAKGIAKGKTEGKEEVVKNMLGKNMDEMLISEISGFSIEKIRDLKKEMKH